LALCDLCKKFEPNVWKKSDIFEQKSVVLNQGRRFLFKRVGDNSVRQFIRNLMKQRLYSGAETFFEQMVGGRKYKI